MKVPLLPVLPILLRIEEAPLLAPSALLYGLNERSWLLFVLLFLVLDVSMVGSQVGANYRSLLRYVV